MSKTLLFIGIACLVLTAFIVYSGLASETVTMNGQTLSREEFLQSGHLPLRSLPPLLVGVFFTVWGGRLAFQDRKTEKFGSDFYGVVTDIHNTFFRVNRVYQKKALIEVLTEDGSIQEVSVFIGSNREGYNPGCFVKVKYLNGHAILRGQANAGAVPEQLKMRSNQ